jgi:two-component system invasion response regulator UvrY
MCRVVISDDSDIMRSAIRGRLEDDPAIEIVGEAASFAETIDIVYGSEPDVVVLDLTLPEKEQFSPELVKSVLRSVTTVAVSIAHDEAAHALARSYGAVTLLDKINLYTVLIPAIQQRGCDEPQKSSFETAAN